MAIYDTNGSWGKYEHRIYSSAKKLGIKFFWVSGNKIKEFKKTIEKNNNLYESMLDKTTQSLEKIISNTESLSKIQ